MKRDLEIPLADAHSSARYRTAPLWAVGLAVVGILGIFWETAASIVAIWTRSETFAHGFIIIPICVWIAWLRRDALSKIPARPWWPALAGVLVAGALWFLGAMAGARVVQQFALAFMLQAAIVAIIGPQQARALVLPLAFLLFAVPTGEFLIPTLMEWTADFTVWALRVSGVPVHREANSFVIPSGRWSVVEACSGVRYVIASLVVGIIYAVISYGSSRRRAIFIAASVVVPIIANWLRAYMIVMIGHLSSNKLATGIDHVIYGWIFFGLVMLLLFWVGAIWRDPAASLAVDVGAFRPSRFQAVISAPPASFFIIAAVAIGASSVWQGLDNVAHNRSVKSVPVLADIPGENGWTASTAEVVDWKPDYRGSRVELRRTYSQGGREVGLYIAYYRNQVKGRELVTSDNELANTHNTSWRRVDFGNDVVSWKGSSSSAERGTFVSQRDRIDALALYWVGGHVTSSPYVAKAWQAWSSLTGHDDAALIVWYAPVQSDQASTRQALRVFAKDMSAPIDRALTAVREDGR